MQRRNTLLEQRRRLWLYSGKLQIDKRLFDNLVPGTCIQLHLCSFTYIQLNISKLVAGKYPVADFRQQASIVLPGRGNHRRILINKQLVRHHLHTVAHLLQQQLAGAAVNIYNLYFYTVNRCRKSMLQWQDACHCSTEQNLIQLHSLNILRKIRTVHQS